MEGCFLRSTLAGATAPRRLRGTALGMPVHAAVHSHGYGRRHESPAAGRIGPRPKNRHCGWTCTGDMQAEPLVPFCCIVQLSSGTLVAHEAPTCSCDAEQAGENSFLFQVTCRKTTPALCLAPGDDARKETGNIPEAGMPRGRVSTWDDGWRKGSGT
jgi:hypothetical protein